MCSCLRCQLTSRRWIRTSPSCTVWPALIAAAAGEYDDDIFLQMGDSEVDAASSLLIMTLGAEKGAEVTVSSDNAEAVDKIAGMVEQDLDA